MNKISLFQLLVELPDCNTWEKKLGTFVEITSQLKNFNLSLEMQHNICSSAYYLIKAVFNYDCSGLPPLRTSITLLKPRIQPIDSMSENYGLDKVSLCSFLLFFYPMSTIDTSIKNYYHTD